MITLQVTNRSKRKRLYRKPVLKELAECILQSESVTDDVELSLLFCDDEEMAALNSAYRGKQGPTDVLAFTQEGLPELSPRPLGDIVISLETVENRNEEDTQAMRMDVRLLFCHGLLHLLGYDHDTVAGQRTMVKKQALYLGCSEEEAWRDGRGAHGPEAGASRGSNSKVGRG